MKRIAYTFDDIQIVPAYSEITSRSECKSETRFTEHYTIGCPLVSSPMDTVTELDMAKELCALGGVGVVHRFMSIDDQAKIIEELVNSPTWKLIDAISALRHSAAIACAAIGVIGDFEERAEKLVEAGANILLIDVAHGNTKLMKDALTWLKQNLPSHVDLIAGNVATREGAINLAEWGANAIRVGIGGGCFTPDMEVRTPVGNRRISELRIGDEVYTHLAKIEPIVDTMEFYRDEIIYEINGIESTHNHEYYVIHIDDVDKIHSDDDIHRYAMWIEASALTESYMLVELDNV